ncbi:hypothetical protein L1987_10320 [Smallanthus sonchifolius]|uniref:Uncharacterized protein n=1 Tax=Smallanthus sonchifolius TaxID=185202 RepID=A0ACB9JS34_9ASTR|nr:hypothetical protein L1987_10320 [Smallanthus sonchifolius]
MAGSSTRSHRRGVPSVSDYTVKWSLSGFEAFKDGVDVGDGSIPAFVAAKKSTTTLKTVVRGENIDYNGDLKSDLKEKKSLPLKVEMNAKAEWPENFPESYGEHICLSFHDQLIISSEQAQINPNSQSDSQ